MLCLAGKAKSKDTVVSSTKVNERMLHMPEYNSNTRPVRPAGNGSHPIRRKKRKKSSPLSAVLIAALVIIAIVGIILFACGYRYINVDGVKFTGFVKDGQPVSGTVKYADGISGKLVKEPDSANGTITYSTGDVYEGEIKGILRDGTGKITYKADGSVYSGDFKEDKLTGNATYTVPGGITYTGEVLDGKKHGLGKCVFADGSYYYGEWENNMRNGVGEEHYSDGSVYYGSFVDDKRSGSQEVTVQLENGMVYTGKPKVTYANGDEYVGDFQNDRRSGYGKYVWATGESYEGEFANDMMNGTGTYDFGNGKEPYTGTFVNGQIAESSDTTENTDTNTPENSTTTQG